MYLFLLGIKNMIIPKQGINIRYRHSIKNYFIKTLWPYLKAFYKDKIKYTPNQGNKAVEAIKILYGKFMAFSDQAWVISSKAKLNTEVSI